MIYLFHGTDQSKIQDTLIKWQKAFLQKNPDSTNLIKYTPDQINIPSLISELKSLPFLEDKRLVILPEFPDKISKEDQKKLSDEFKNLPDTTILCISSFKKLPKTTNPIHKELIKLQKKDADNFHINELSSSEQDLSKTLQQIISSYDKTISAHDAQELVKNLGSNSIKIKSEANKLGLYSANQQITKEDIQLICSYTTETNVFHLMDHITLGQTKQALQKIQELQDNGEDLMRIFYLIIRQFRILIQLNSLASEPISEKEIASLTKLHPYVVKKTIPQARKFNPNQLLQTYNQLLQLDRKIKTGKVKPEELHTEFLSFLNIR